MSSLKDRLKALFAPAQFDDEVLTKLRAARDLLAKGWCINSQGRDADDNPVDPLHMSAVKFCLYGAFRRAGLVVEYDVHAKDPGSALLMQVGGFRPSPGPSGSVWYSAVRWNNANTQADVVGLMDRVIEARRAMVNA